MFELPVIWNFAIQRSSDDNNTSLPVENFFSKTEIICIQIVFGILFFLGTTGNISTIVAFLRSPDLRIQPATKFVISLAVSDLLYCLIYMPSTIAIYNDSKINDSVWCPIYQFLTYWFVNVSLITLMAISINRYVMICHNYLYQRIYTNSNVFVMISIIWIFTAGPLLLPLTGIWGKFGKNEMGRCNMIELKAEHLTLHKRNVLHNSQAKKECAFIR